jgi:DNA-binding transcriptional LysR family regulator
MNTNDLTIFVEIMRKRNFAAVARDRNINPAGVSRSIAALEKELNARLFQRTTRRVEPTEAALVYFQRVEPLVCELNNARLLVAEQNERVQGVLRFSCPVSFAQLNITPLMPEFSERFPELNFDLVLSDSILDLINERLDAAIRIGSLTDSNLIAQKLSPMVARVCAAPDYLEKHGRPNKPEDLINHKCLLLELATFAGDLIVPVKLDITDEAQIAAAVEQASDTTVLINNAGVLSGGSFLGGETDSIARQFETNFYGTLKMIRAFASVIERNGGGAIANILSVVSLASMAGLGGYSASKAAAFSLTQAVRADLKARNITVHAVFPGPVDTDMASEITLPKTSAKDVAAAIVKGIADGAEDIFPDAMSAQLSQVWGSNPKEMERMFASM